MAIMFYNIKSGERRLCETEPMISAHFNSSDRNPNAHQGQDMGWRLAPETVIEMERISQDPSSMHQIATSFGIPTDDLSQTDVLNWISRQSNRQNTGASVPKGDLEREYQADINRLRDEDRRRDQVIIDEAQSRGEAAPRAVLDRQAKETSQTSESNNDNIESEQSAPVELAKMKREELNNYAQSVGIDNPTDYSNGPKLIEAIKAKEEEES